MIDVELTIKHFEDEEQEQVIVQITLDDGQIFDLNDMEVRDLSHKLNVIVEMLDG